MEEKSDSRVPPPRVRIFECAHDGIQELFNRDSSKATKPMDERNFPKSFWIPPTKENSEHPDFSIENNQDGLSISHRKSNSSPSCIGTNPAYPSEPIDHNRQKSLDTTQNFARNLKESPMMSNAGLLSHTNRGYTAFFRFYLCSVHSITRMPDSLIALHHQFASCHQNFRWLLMKTNRFISSTMKQSKPHGWGMTIEELDQIHINFARRQKINAHSLEV